MATIEYFYAAHSAFAYIGSSLLSEIASSSGSRLVHRPYDLRRAIEALGTGVTGSLTAARRAYFFGREVMREAEWRGAEIMPGVPTHHANDIGLPNRLLIAGVTRGENIDRLAHALLEAHWRDDADLADAPTLQRLADAVGHDGTALLAEAASAAVAATYDANTAEAIRRPVFGSPTYIVDGDMFYGQDRLEQVLRATRQPFRT